MASETLNALFTAKEQISGALEKAGQATSSFQREISELNYNLALVEAKSEGAEQQFDSLATASRRVNNATTTLDRSLSEARTALFEMGSASGATEEQIQDFQRSVRNANIASKEADRGIESMSRSLIAAREASDMTNEQFKNLRNSVLSVGQTTRTAQSGLNTLNSALIGSSIASGRAEESTEKLNDQLNQTTASATSAAGALTVLGAAANSNATEFGSLSINIGPFNLALRNIMVQLPAIITGLGSVLAVVVALGAAFLTLGGAMAAFIGAGAIAFFEEFSGQFEDSAEAIEAMTGALMDLFKEAIEPLMTEANMELFIDSINLAARVVNRFAQFFAQIRDEVMSFGDDIGGSADEWFNALNDGMVMLMPVMSDIINFFAERGPDALRLFSRITLSLSESLGPLIDQFRELFVQLLDLSTAIVDGVAPVLTEVIQIIAGVAAVFNAAGEGVTAFIAQMVVLSFVGMRVYSMATAVTGALATLSTAMTAQAAAGSNLFQMLNLITGSMYHLVFGSLTLSGAYANLTLAVSTLRASLMSLLATRLSYVKTLLTENALMNISIGRTMRSTAVRLTNAKASLAQRSATLASAAAQNIYRAAVVAGNIATMALSGNLVGAAAAFKLTTLSALSTAATFIGGLIPATIAAGTAFNLAFAGIPLILGAIVTGGAAMVGVMGNAGSVTGGLTSAFGSLKNMLSSFANIMMQVWIPAWNAFVSLAELILIPLFVLMDVWGQLMSMFSSSDGGSGGFFGGLVSAFDLLANKAGAFFGYMDKAINFLAQIIKTTLLVPINLFLGLLRLIVDASKSAVESFNGFKILGDILSGVKSQFKGFKDFINDMIDGFISLVNKAIRAYNKIPKVDDIDTIDLSDGETDLRTSEEEMSSDQEEQDNDDISTEPDVNLNFEDNLEQNIDVDADPEESEQMRRTVKDAMDEANALQRRREGHGG